MVPTTTERTRLPSEKQPVLRVTPMPADVNKHGDVFGGWIMSQVDLAGGLVASHRARGRVVTVAVNEFTFKEPVFVGDLLSFYVDIVRVGRTSITVEVDVYAMRNPGALQVTKVTEARCTYVATDDDRKPRPVDPEN